MSDDLVRMGDMLGSVIRTARANSPLEPDDYVNEADGLVYCGKCHTPREHKMTFPAAGEAPERTLKVPVACKCRSEEIARREEIARIKGLKVSSLMDTKFKDSTFEVFQVTKFNSRQLKMCRRYAEHFAEMKEKNQGLLFYGDVGTGKTYMAACIANHLMDRLTPCVMTSFVKILQSIQGFRSDDEEERFIVKMNRASLLIIDDLGAERSTDYALEKVYNIIDSRYRARKPMILTTNLALQDMQGTTDIRYSRIYDRIFEVCYPIEFRGGSWRKEEAARRYDEMTKFLEEET